MPSAISRGRALRMVHCSWSGEVVLRPLRSVAAILISHSYRGYTRYRLLATAILGVHMTTAIAALEAIEKDADDANDLLLAVAAINAVAPLRETALVDEPRWRLTEEEIVGVSITVIWVSLMVVISVAVGTALTMS